MEPQTGQPLFSPWEDAGAADPGSHF